MTKWISLLLAAALLLMAMPAVCAEEALLIDQVYGGGGKGDTPIANSFIELYNPGESAVDLTGYSLVYGENTLDLTDPRQGVVPDRGRGGGDDGRVSDL